MGLKPGTTNNPNGRPLKEKCLTNLMAKFLDKIPEGQEIPNKELFIEAVYGQAMDGDNVCQRLIWNYMDGQPKQTMELSGDQAFIEKVRENFKRRNG